MKKTLVTLGLTGATSLFSFAEIKEGDNFEAGAGYHFTSLTSYDDYKFNLNGSGAYFEYRYETLSNLHVGAGRLYVPYR